MAIAVGDGVDAARVDADEADRVGILGRGADGAAERRAGQEQLQAAEQHDRGGEDQHRELADVDVVGERPGIVGERSR